MSLSRHLCRFRARYQFTSGAEIVGCWLQVRMTLWHLGGASARRKRFLAINCADFASETSEASTLLNFLDFHSHFACGILWHD